MRSILLLGILFVAGWTTGLHAAPAAPTLADYRATYEREQNKIRTNNAAVLAADADYLKALEGLQANFKKQGDFDNVMALTTERKRFEATRMVPEQAPDNQPPPITKAQADYRAALARAEIERERQLAKLTTSYVKALKELIKSYLNADQMSEAEKANKELKLVETDLKKSELQSKAVSSKDITATGGTSTTYTLEGKHYTAWLFTDPAESGTFTVSSGTLACEVLVVGGGGGGAAGGGGAGGYLHVSTNLMGTTTVSVGKGGTAGAGYPGSPIPTSGGNSCFGTIVAYGGGYGGIRGEPSNINPAAGGSGGGGYYYSAAQTYGASGTAGQGNNGGGNNNQRAPPYPAGGGGGAASAGGSATSATVAGTGGRGIADNMSGMNVIYASGGNGAIYGSTGAGTSGTANTGTGGSGAGGNFSAGAGGSGIVIVRYLSLEP